MVAKLRSDVRLSELKLPTVIHAPVHETIIPTEDCIFYHDDIWRPNGRPCDGGRIFQSVWITVFIVQEVRGREEMAHRRANEAMARIYQIFNEMATDRNVNGTVAITINQVKTGAGDRVFGDKSPSLQLLPFEVGQLNMTLDVSW